MEIYYSFSEYQSHDFLKKVLGIKGIEDYNISKNSHGKPYIKDIDFDFNISHTKGMIALAVGKNVGIDCEKIRPVKQSVIARVCSEEEMLNLEKSNQKDKDFMLLWTFKEAYTKMLGSGFRYSFKNVNIENAFCLHQDIKIFQKTFGDIVLTALEEKGLFLKMIEI